MTADAFDECETPRKLAIRWLRARANTQAGTPPELASAEWLALPDGHPLKVGSVCRAAIGWLNYTDPEQIKSDLLDELELTDWERRQYVNAEAAKTIQMINRWPNRAELLRRRAS